jgi:hypothetical protein
MTVETLLRSRLLKQALGITLTPLFLLLGYTFMAGVVDAGEQGGPLRMPFPKLNALYCVPNNFLINVPFPLNIPFRLANEFGYRMADGPDTTR